MLRKMKSYSFLSPKRETVLSQPVATPVRAYGIRPSSPTRQACRKEKSGRNQLCAVCLHPLGESPWIGEEVKCRHLVHQSCASDLTECPVCTIPYPLWKKPTAKGTRLKHKASAWLNLRTVTVQPDLPVKAVARLIRPSSLAVQRPSHTISLNTHLKCQFEAVGQSSRDVLLLLETQAYFPDDRHKQKDGPPVHVVIILDLKTAMLARKRFFAPKNTAVMIVNSLKDYDTVSVVTTLRGCEEQKVVVRPTQISEDEKMIIGDAIFDIRLDAAQYETDFLQAFTYARDLLESCPLDQKAHVFFISDGLADGQPTNSRMISRIASDSNISLHALGVGPVVNERALRSLAYCSKDGVCLLIPSSTDIQSLLCHIRIGTFLEPIRDVTISLQLFDTASIRYIKNSDVEAEIHTPQNLIVTVPRLGPYEIQRILLVVHLPAVTLSPRPFRHDKVVGNASLNDNGDDPFTTSFRLAELEHMVQSMPSKLASCSISYVHPLLVTTDIVHQPPTVLSIKRVQVEKPPMDVGVMQMDLRMTIHENLLKVLKFESSGDKESAIRLLRYTEQSIHIFSAEFDLSQNPFEDILSEISSIRFRMSARYQMTVQRKQSFHSSDPQTPSRSPRTQDRQASSFASAVNLKDTAPLKPTGNSGLETAYMNQQKPLFMPRRIASKSVSSMTEGLAPSGPVSRKTLVTTLRTVITESSTNRSRRSSTGSIAPTDHLSAHFVGHEAPPEIQKVIWEKPIMKRLPTSQEIRDIVRHSSSHHNIQRFSPSASLQANSPGSQSVLDRPGSPRPRPSECVGEQQSPQERSAHTDAAKSIWRAHQQQRGESPMLSEDDERLLPVDVLQHSTQSDSVQDVSRQDSSSDYFSKSLTVPVAESTPIRRVNDSESPTKRSPDDVPGSRSGDTSALMIHYPVLASARSLSQYSAIPELQTASTRYPNLQDLFTNSYAKASTAEVPLVLESSDHDSGAEKAHSWESTCSGVS